ncbi:MAG: hypothetical protein HFF05_05340 [Oscillospiraceae bacterium]|nr:hypothetical protein [Oscillospiraceae bacterium]
MDTHMEELFEAVQPFVDGELIFCPEYARLNRIVNTLEDMMEECFGGEVARLMAEYTATRFEAERFQHFHYFCQGYLTARAEKKP